MAKTYYKVVRNSPYASGGKVSCIVVGTRLCCDYSTEKWTKGINGTPVLAFSTLGSARTFVSDCTGQEIWEAKVRRPRKISKLGYWPGGLSALLFWPSIQGKRWHSLDNSYLGPADAPPDTVACDAIKLVKKVS